MSVSRRSVLGWGAACAAAWPSLAQAAATPGDMTIGGLDSRVRLLEYASLTCPHCAAFHASVFPRLKTEYIDTGRIAFTLREFPTPPAPVSFAMFQLARAGGADAATYYERVAILFARQQAILGTGTMGGVRDALITIGAEWGLPQEEVMAVIQDQAGAERVQATVDEGHARYGIGRTPSLVLNDRLLDVALTFEALAPELDRALAG